MGIRLHPDPIQHLADRGRVPAPAVPFPDRELAGRGLAGADDRLVRHQPVLADPRAQAALVGVRDLGPQTAVDARRRRPRPRASSSSSEIGQYDQLHRRQPGRERAAVHLDELGDGSFDAADDRCGAP